VFRHVALTRDGRFARKLNTFAYLKDIVAAIEYVNISPQTKYCYFIVETIRTGPEHGPWTRVTKIGPCLRAVNTGSVYRPLNGRRAWKRRLRNPNRDNSTFEFPSAWSSSWDHNGGVDTWVAMESEEERASERDWSDLRCAVHRRIIRSFPRLRDGTGTTNNSWKTTCEITVLMLTRTKLLCWCSRERCENDVVSQRWQVDLAA